MYKQGVFECQIQRIIASVHKNIAARLRFCINRPSLAEFDGAGTHTAHLFSGQSFFTK
jgi:hypothetical protein